MGRLPSRQRACCRRWAPRSRPSTATRTLLPQRRRHRRRRSKVLIGCTGRLPEESPFPMFRFIFYLITTIILISVVRMVAGVLLKGVGAFFGTSGSSHPGTANSVPMGGELKKD